MNPPNKSRKLAEVPSDFQDPKNYLDCSLLKDNFLISVCDQADLDLATEFVLC